MSKVLNFKQELTACFGQPVSENPTQVMMEAAYRHHGLDWRYLTIEVAPHDLATGVAGARAMGFRGFNCTIPHKVAVIAHLDGLGESASLMGAVNCVVRRGEKLIGENTDGKGFVKSLKELVDPTGKHAVIFGAGGAARAIGVEVALAGATEITIVNRSPSRGKELAALLTDKVRVKTNLVAWDQDYVVPEGVDIVINATSIGLFPDVDARLALDVNGPGLQGHRRPWHAGQSGDHRRPLLVRHRAGRRRDEKGARRRLRRVDTVWKLRLARRASEGRAANSFARASV